MAHESDDPMAEHWKRRYREQIAELDRLEEEWRASDKVLRRAIGRLARCGAGQSDALDQAIDALQQGVRDERPADDLGALVDRLSAELLTDERDGSGQNTAAGKKERQPEAAPRSQGAGVATARGLLLTLLDRLPAPVIEQSLDSLRQRLEQAESERALAEVVDALAEYLGSLQPIADSDERPTSGEGKPGETHSILLRLLEQIAVPDEFAASIDSVRSRLETASSESEWSILVTEIAELINAVRAHLQTQKQDLAQFVEHIGGRIEMLGTLLEEQSTTMQDQAHQGHIFDQDIGAHMRSLRDDVGAAADLEQVKDSVDKRLNRMSEQLHRHRQEEQQRLDGARARFEQLQQRLGELEREGEQLRNAIRRKDAEALIDPLTGIANRGGYDQRVLEEFQRWQRFGTPLSLALFDIDHFKRINDDYGHRAGDKALRVIAQLLAQRLRRIDFLARYGGEEFVVLLPGTAAESAFTVIDQLRARVAASGFHYRGEPVTISVSAGITGFGMDDTIESVVDRADKALYEGKQFGRDRCVLHAPPESGS